MRTKEKFKQKKKYPTKEKSNLQKEKQETKS